MKTTSLPKKELLVYALIAMPLAIVGLPLYIYLPTFYATDIGVNIALVGVFLFVARITDVLTDPYIGYLSDQSLKHFHSRKPIMYVGAFILAVSFYLLIHPSPTQPALWLFTFSILIYIGWSMVTIPYLTWSSEISEVYYHKTQLNSVREIATIVGLALALVIPYFFESSATQDKLNTLYFFFLLLFVPFFIITMLKIRIKTTQSSGSFSFKNIKKVYEIIPDLKNLQLGYFLNNLANAIPATLFLLFIEVVIEEKDFSEEILILYFVSGVIALPIWTLLSQKVGKKMVWVSSMVLASFSFIFVIFLEANDIVLFAIISFVSGLSLGADIAFPTSIQADIVQKIKTVQDNISGVLFGIWTMITKLALALSVVITFGILGMVDFDKDNLTQTSIITLTLLYGLLPIILKLIALKFIFKFNESTS